jgi:DUF1680 family protein
VTGLRIFFKPRRHRGAEISLFSKSIALLLFFCYNNSNAQIPGIDYPYQPVKFSEVRINDKFWLPRIEVNRTVTIPFAFMKCDTTGRIRNFEVAGKVNSGEISSGKFCSLYGYDDSDVYKIVEGASYSLSTDYDSTLDVYLDKLIAKIAGAQEKDGYLYSMRTIDPIKSWAKERWVNDRIHSSHELYDAGHMVEAAVAHFYATRKKSFLNVAIKNADLLCDTFGPDKMHTVPGHQEIEIGLIKLYRVTGNKKYLDLAKFFLDERGKGDDRGGEYNQDDKPVTEQDEATGHAVRAGYMYSAMADVAALTGDPSYIRAIDHIWENVTGKKIYITGGIGANRTWEGFGKDYELPNDTGYNETCAAIANVFWNWRMFLLHGDSKYIDVLERTLYNGLISGVALKGNTFFYPNPLESNGTYKRSEWFGCSCCPSNITRFISSVSGYIYATKNDSLFVNLFIGNNASFELNGKNIEVTEETGYPWDGKIRVRIGIEPGNQFAVCFRIPCWLTGSPIPGDLYSFEDENDEKPFLAVNDTVISARYSKGYACIERKWKNGDEIELTLPMPVRKVIANPLVKADKNKVCLVRGPIVFCAEGLDNHDHVNNIIIPVNAVFEASFQPALLNGVEVVSCSDFTLIPYYAWCNRGAGKMNVWFNELK